MKCQKLCNRNKNLFDWTIQLLKSQHTAWQKSLTFDIPPSKVRPSGEASSQRFLIRILGREKSRHHLSGKQLESEIRQRIFLKQEIALMSWSVTWGSKFNASERCDVEVNNVERVSWSTWKKEESSDYVGETHRAALRTGNKMPDYKNYIIWDLNMELMQHQCVSVFLH